MACLAYFHRVSKEKSAITSAKHWRKTFRSDPSEGSGDKKIFQPSVSNCSSRWRYIVTFYRKTKKLKPKTNLFLQITEKMRFRYITKGKLPASYLYFSGYEDGRSNSVKYRQFQIIYIPKKQKQKKKPPHHLYCREEPDQIKMQLLSDVILIWIWKFHWSCLVLFPWSRHAAVAVQTVRADPLSTLSTVLIG